MSRARTGQLPRHPINFLVERPEADSEEGTSDLDPLLLSRALLPKAMAKDDSGSLHTYFYETLRNGYASAEAQSASRRQKILAGQGKQGGQGLRASTVYEDLYAQERISDANFSGNPLHLSSDGNGSSKATRKPNCLYPGWEKSLKSDFNDPNYIHGEFYSGITQAAATGAALSRIRLGTLSKQKDDARHV
jgi:hypothetical protein